MKMFKRSLALIFAVLLCCMTVFAVSANGEDNDIVDDWDGAPEEEYYNGDLNNDDVVDLVDLGIFDKYFLNSIEESEFDIDLADINGDSEVDLVDLGIMDKYFLNSLSDDEIAQYNLPAAE